MFWDGFRLFIFQLKSLDGVIFFCPFNDEPVDVSGRATSTVYIKMF